MRKTNPSTHVVIRVLIALVVAVFCSCAAQPIATPAPQSAGNNEATKVEIKLKLDKERFLVSEDVLVTVSLTNSGRDAIQIPDPFHKVNWQPVYTLLGPGLPDGGEVFSFRSVTTGDRRGAPDDVPPALVPLQPGETIEDGIPLHQWVELGRAGKYRLSARLAWGAISAQAAPVEFELEKPELTSVAVGVDERVSGRLGEWVDWLHRGPQGVRLYTALYSEPKIDMHGFKAFSVSAVRDVAATATDVLTPWSNYNRQIDIPKWRAWREGSTVFALATIVNEPQRLDLGAEPQALVRPALMTSSGVLDVFAVGAGSRELVAARFPRPVREGESQPPPKIIARVPLSGAIVGARAALAPESREGGRHVVVTWDESDAFVIGHVTVSAAGEASAMSVSRHPDTRSLPGSEPALRVDEQGTAHIAVLCKTGVRLRSPTFGIIDASFRPGQNEPVKSNLSELGSLPSPPKAAASTFCVSAGAPMRRDWVILFDGNRVMNSRSAPRLHQLPGPAVLPLQLVAITDATYLITLNPAMAIEFATQL